MHYIPTEPDRLALFLDFDGTLVEIAARPDMVERPQGLRELLERLAARLNGAVCIVSGRSIAQLEAVLAVALPMAGEHGASLRPSPFAALRRRKLPTPPPAWIGRAKVMAASFPGAFVERKAHGFVLHYRLAPEAEGIVRTALEQLIDGRDDFVVMAARMAWEVKPRGTSKSDAVVAMMAEPAFIGRIPVFIGDDITDEAGFEAARAAGGHGLRLQDTFGTPAALRAWLARLAADK